MRYDFPMILPALSRMVSARLLAVWDRLYSRWKAWLWGIETNGPFLFRGRAWIWTRRRGEIRLGRNVIFSSRKSLNTVGLTGPTILETREGGRIEIGDDSGFSSVVMSSRSSITIGNGVNIGGNTRIFDHDFHSLRAEDRRDGARDKANVRTKPIVIGDDCFIGANAILLKGTRLGARTIVAAGSVVFGLETPPDSLVKGNPACVVPRSPRAGGADKA